MGVTMGIYAKIGAETILFNQFNRFMPFLAGGEAYFADVVSMSRLFVENTHGPKAFLSR
jgi:hypothetical protein